MKGFFDSNELSNSSAKGGLFNTCSKCKLYRDCITPNMEVWGNFRKGILNLGEAPGEKEDERGKPWQGKAGRKLRKAYESLGIDLYEDCANLNSVSCRPPDNRTPGNKEIACCRGKVLRFIEDYKPHVIVAFGNAAIQCLMDHRTKKQPGGITKWRGFTAPDRNFNAWVCPVHHPSFLNRWDSEEARNLWHSDLKRALGKVEEPMPNFKDEREQVIILKETDEICKVLDGLRKGKYGNRAAFDYEGTGLKPYATGHCIYSVSIAPCRDWVWAFMVHSNSRLSARLKRFLTSPQVNKMAHNMKFEQNWSAEYLGVEVSPWEWDSMLAAHILDNRKGVTGLKFQSYVRYGVMGYDDAIEPYLEGQNKKDANSFNNINKFVKKYGEDELLIYNGVDSLLEFRLAEDQMREIGYETA